MNFKKFQFTLQTIKREQFILITQNIQDIVTNSGIKDGLCKIFIPHTTAGITINENTDPDIRKDFTSFLDEIIPPLKRYRHSEGNSDAHIKSSLIGSSLDVIIEHGLLDLGQWQGIYFSEFDGPRTRIVKIMIIY